MSAHRKELNIQGSDLWYLVGLITSDGCLCKDGRHVDITAKDRGFLETVKNRVGLVSRVCVKNKNTYKQAHRIQISNKNFYEFLLSIGLMPNKSLMVGRVNVTQDYFADFLRGLIDGDGCIRSWKHPTNGREQWSLRIYSGSRQFIAWLKDNIESLLKAQGKAYRAKTNLWTLKYGKMAAREIIRQCYYQNCLGLTRKIKLAQECLDSYKGWSKSKTILN